MRHVGGSLHLFCSHLLLCCWLMVVCCRGILCAHDSGADLLEELLLKIHEKYVLLEELFLKIHKKVVLQGNGNGKCCVADTAKVGIEGT